MRIHMAIIAIAALQTTACTGLAERTKQYEAQCRAQWKDSGYKTRVVVTKVTSTTTYDCQLLVDGRWIPSDHLRFPLETAPKSASQATPS